MRPLAWAGSPDVRGREDASDGSDKGRHTFHVRNSARGVWLAGLSVLQGVISVLDLLTPSKSPSLTRSYVLCLVLSVATSLAHADIGEVKCNYSGYFAGPEGGQTA